MDRQRLRRHRINNVLQSILLLGGILAVFGVVAWAIGGATIMIWVLIGSALGLVFGPKLSPALIVRLYGAREIVPAAAPELHAVVAALARRADLPAPPRLFYIPSMVLNAFTLGRRDAAVITVTDALLRTMNRRELIAILAHEVSHIRHNDMWIMGLADTVSRLTRLLAGFGWLLLILSLPAAAVGYGRIPWLAVLALVVSPTASALLQLALARTREFDADLGAVELIGDPEALISALAKLESHQGGLWERMLMPGRRNPEPSVLRTHPPTEQRIARLRALKPAARQRFPAFDLSGVLADRPRPTRPPRHGLSGLWR